jgi:arylsulfatase A-like enzyme
MMKRTTLKALALAFALAAAGCAHQAPTSTTAAKPRLVVLLVMDGLPQRQVVDYRDQMAPDGFRRFLDRGAWFSDAHYGHAHTATGPGHATMLSGTYAHRHGIIGNEWRNTATNEMEYCTGDTAHTYIGHKTNKLDGTSPKNLRAETVGDVLRGFDPRSKVIAISGKDRGAILPAGHKGTAYMYMAQTGEFASSTYYMKEHPEWVRAFHAAKPAHQYWQAEWKPLLADNAYGSSLADEQKWYAKGGRLPKKMGDGQDKPGPLFYGGLVPSPFSDALSLDFARAAIAGEGLGRDDAPDILSVSLSAHDYINHAYGAESRISHDHILQADRLLERFFADLDRTVGRDNYLVVMTSDHGFMPAVEHSQSLGRNAGKMSGSQTIAKVNAALKAKFGEGDWVRSISARGLVFDRKLMAEKKVDTAAMHEEARRVLLAEPGIAVVYSRAELESGAKAGQPFFDSMRRSWHRDISADLQYAEKAYWMHTSSSSATTHGSPHPYDTQVPILVYGPAWVKPGRYDARVEVADIAPTLSGILGIPVPKQSEGKPLPVR